MNLSFDDSKIKYDTFLHIVSYVDDFSEIISLSSVSKEFRNCFIDYSGDSSYLNVVFSWIKWMFSKIGKIAIIIDKYHIPKELYSILKYVSYLSDNKILFVMQRNLLYNHMLDWSDVDSGSSTKILSGSNSIVIDREQITSFGQFLNDDHKILDQLQYIVIDCSQQMYNMIDYFSSMNINKKILLISDVNPSSYENNLGSLSICKKKIDKRSLCVDVIFTEKNKVSHHINSLFNITENYIIDFTDSKKHIIKRGLEGISIRISAIEGSDYFTCVIKEYFHAFLDLSNERKKYCEFIHKRNEYITLYKLHTTIVDSKYHYPFIFLCCSSDTANDLIVYLKFITNLHIITINISGRELDYHRKITIKDNLKFVDFIDVTKLIMITNSIKEYVYIKIGLNNDEFRMRDENLCKFITPLINKTLGKSIDQLSLKELTFFYTENISVDEVIGKLLP